MPSASARSAGVGNSRLQKKKGREKNMLRAMDSAVAGLRAHQNKLDVISHNIANVNTVGFKSQAYNFKEAMYQTSTSSTKSEGTKYGGVNASQYGYGSLTGSIATDMTASTPTYFGGLNCSIDGQGFFITRVIGTGSIADTSLKTSDIQFTRVGQFNVNAEGYLVDANGNFIYGYQPKIDAKGVYETKDGIQQFETQLKALRLPAQTNADAATSADAAAYSFADKDKALVASNVKVNKAGELTATVEIKYKPAGATEELTEKKVISFGKIAIANFQNQEGLTKTGDNYYTADKSDNTGDCVAAMPGGDSVLMTGYLEVSNVDLSKEFADMITTQRGFQANCKIITVSDEVLQELVNMKR